MAVVSLEVDWRRFRDESERLEELASSMETLAVGHRKLVAEIIMIRLVLLAENTISSICMKLLSGADYLDGRRPKRMVAASSKAKAEALMKQFGRTKPTGHLSWLRSREIRRNLKYTLEPTDPLLAVVLNYGALLTDMTYVRNHIAHKSESSRRHFRDVVRKYYGGLKRGVTPGVLLLTEAFGKPVLVTKYIAYYRVLIRELVRG